MKRLLFLGNNKDTINDKTDDIGINLSNGIGAIILTAQGVSGTFDMDAAFVGVTGVSFSSKVSLEINTTGVSVNETIDGKLLSLKAGPYIRATALRH